MMGVMERNNVHVRGAGDQAIVFVHGFGCDQNMWRFVAPEFEKDHMTVVFDHVGAGGSDLKAYDNSKYSTLSGYADDVVEIGRELGLKDAVFVGHSVSSMIGVLAAAKAPGMFGKLVLIGPSARYIDDDADGYVGGFTAAQIEELLQFLESNHMGWSAQMAPAIMGNPDRPELGEELTNSFCRTDPEIAKAFARVTFTSDNRKDLAGVDIPVLVLQCSEDIIKAFWATLQERRKEEKTRAALYDLSDRELTDIGIAPGEIEYVASNLSLDPRGIYGQFNANK